ncbi:MAG TPA: hypothetical protein VFQ92_15465, partial [Blastocatellia bacterium]|nr:hypothetical protein [Blastocatellia bacterium]
MPEDYFLKTTPIEQRKALGQFLTPESIAAPMVRWVTCGYKATSLLDAGTGTGVFVKSFLRGRKQHGVNK